jgi:hypothetical protein
MEQALKAFLRVLSILILVVVTSQSQASTNDLELLFGPQTLQGHLGNPQTESIDLTLPAGEYLLVIQNGTPVAIAECPKELSWDLLVCRVKNGFPRLHVMISFGTNNWQRNLFLEGKINGRPLLITSNNSNLVELGECDLVKNNCYLENSSVNWSIKNLRDDGGSAHLDHLHLGIYQQGQ